MTTTEPDKVHVALAKVMADVRAVGKEGHNSAQNFNFRGIDGVLNAVGPALRTHQVVVLPQLVSIEQKDVEVGRNRTLMGHVTLQVRYVFVGPDGSTLEAVVPGEAMDSGDKAVSKAMSVALRTALIQALALPTDQPDPDEQSYERSAAPPPAVRFVCKEAKDQLIDMFVQAGMDSDGAKAAAAAVWKQGPCPSLRVNDPVTESAWAELVATASDWIENGPPDPPGSGSGPDPAGEPAEGSTGDLEASGAML